MIDHSKIRPRERRMLNNGRDMYHEYSNKGECRIMARKIRAWGFDVVDVTNKSLTYEVM